MKVLPWRVRAPCPPNSVSARRLHRWLGLTLGVWFLLVGATGAILVYWHALEAVELPRPAAGATMPFQALLEAASRHMNDIPWRFFPADEHSAHARAVFLTDPGRITLLIEPSTGAVQGSLPWRGALVHWVYDLHANALGGRTGKLLVGLSALPLLLMLGLGLRLWLKRGSVPIRESIIPRRGLRGRRLLSHAHRVAGFWALPPLLLAAVTGLSLSFPDTTREVLQPFTAPSPEFRVPLAKGTGPVDLDGAMAALRAAMPGWRLAWAEPPDDEVPDWTLVLLPEAQAWPSGRAAAYVNAHTGRLEEVRLPDSVDHIRAWIMALHNGEAFGLAHRLLVIALGLTLCGMAVLGLLLWLRGRRKAAAPLPA